MKLLADLGANPLLTNEDGSTPLMVAAGLGTNAPGEDPGTEPEVLEAVKVALDLGNDLNAVDKNGETAMHGAAYKHVPTVVQYLAEKGAREDVWNRPNSKGWTPLKITEGVQRGMNIVSSPATAAVIRQVLAESRRSSDDCRADARPSEALGHSRTTSEREDANHSAFFDRCDLLSVVSSPGPRPPMTARRSTSSYAPRVTTPARPARRRETSCRR